MQVQHFCDLAADLFNWVERGHRILKYHRDFVAADFAQVLVGHLGQVLAVEKNLAANDFARIGDQTHDRHRHDTFATAGFADDADGFASLDSQIDTAHGLNRSDMGEKGSFKLANIQ